jgi:hypothetical protein
LGLWSREHENLVILRTSEDQSGLFPN